MDKLSRISITALRDELEKITQAEKVAGIGSFLMKGIRGWGSAAKGASRAAAGKGGRTWGSHVGIGLGKGQKGGIRRLYEQGAKKGGVLGGVKRVAKSPYGAMAGTVGVGGLAAYGGYKALSGGTRQQRY